MTKLLNAFSLNMLPPPKPNYLGDHFDIATIGISLEGVKLRLAREGVESCIGHADTARILSDILGMEIPVNRVSVTLEKGETAIVAQYTGPRLPEGATELPDGAQITFRYVRIEE